MQPVLRQISSRPRLALWACLVLLVALSFLSLAALSRGEGAWLPDSLRALCTPGLAAADARFCARFAMWAAMVLVMMLPSAAPMLSTYLDIAEAARTKAIAVASPFMLAGGYVAVWLAFAATAALAQALAGPVTDRRLAGLFFVIAGLYQFTSLKHACLAKCRHPMPYFLAHWTEHPAGVFRMGLEQGLNCLGCCWAIMLLAFIAGTMNIVWMALVGGAMILEKVMPDPRILIAGLGAGLTAAGFVMLIAG
jgi:predicted metal-binding membrane protein